ncbi:hypothetical protein BSF41_36570 [Flavobacterium sp. ACN2]|jgi:hypothetical protein|uniref:hypothetical protein n=1 Tax=unclassified Flavobacterium TaxID=196869 RepID=UPI000BB34816|nr:MULTISPECIES: hypothetical protein [unclassified Flavobacterium]MDY0986504.1 hypothetical protein [Flavobacterium sp. CFBP9031]PBI85680.1 hypothetical protein BSF41_36570 [Flavobacterium sp. ACN2]
MIFVFKTNVDSISKVKKVTPKLNRLFPDSKWNFDLEDRDNILRFECKDDIIEKVIFLMKVIGFECEAL